MVSGSRTPSRRRHQDTRALAKVVKQTSSAPARPTLLDYLTTFREDTQLATNIALATCPDDPQRYFIVVIIYFFFDLIYLVAL